MALSRTRATSSISLVLALCHEIGNDLAAARLSAHLLAHPRSRAELEQGAVAIEAVVAQADALLAQIRPLLVGARDQICAVSTRSLLETVDREVRSLGPSGARLEIRRPRRVLDVHVDPSSLSSLLLSLALDACEAAGKGGRVRLFTRNEPARVRFVLEEGSPKLEPLGVGRGSAGRALWLEIARAVLKGMGGSVEIRQGKRQRRTELSLPARLPPRSSRRPTARRGAPPSDR
jgi:nitrogen-specific signal transduction histidine kinase